MDGLCVFGGPFAGKSTLAKLLCKKGIPYVETDELQTMLIGKDHELWKAWYDMHPRHEEWRNRVGDVLYGKEGVLENALKRGKIVVRHDPMPDFDPQKQCFLIPNADELRDRMDKWVMEHQEREEIDQSLSRVIAYAHWSTKALINKWNEGSTMVHSADQALQWIVEHFNLQGYEDVKHGKVT